LGSWHDLTGNINGEARMCVMAVFMQRAYGGGVFAHTAAISIVVPLVLAASASVLASLLGLLCSPQSHPPREHVASLDQLTDQGGGGCKAHTV
jgi:hypothetical protein